MELSITLPDEFEEHFNYDAFQDSFKRIKSDISTNECLSGLYEIELVDALIEAFKKAKSNSTVVDILDSEYISKIEAYELLRDAGVRVKMNNNNSDIIMENGELLIGKNFAFLEVDSIANSIYNIGTTGDVSIPAEKLTKAHIVKFISDYKALEKEMSK